jgi:hypothetical protein
MFPCRGDEEELGGIIHKAMLERRTARNALVSGALICHLTCRPTPQAGQ